jgi:hypothetical protein
MELNESLIIDDCKAEIKGIFMPGTFITFPRDDGKYYSVFITVNNKEEKMILPEWFVEKFFKNSAKIQAEKEKERLRIEQELQAAIDKQISEQISQQEQSYGRHTSVR